MLTRDFLITIQVSISERHHFVIYSNTKKIRNGTNQRIAQKQRELGEVRACFCKAEAERQWMGKWVIFKGSGEELRHRDPGTECLIFPASQLLELVSSPTQQLNRMSALIARNSSCLSQQRLSQWWVFWTCIMACVCLLLFLPPFLSASSYSSHIAAYAPFSQVLIYFLCTFTSSFN